MSSAPRGARLADFTGTVVIPEFRAGLGMPDGALSSSHIRYHAHRAGVTVHETLEATLDAALSIVLQ